MCHYGLCHNHLEYTNILTFSFLILKEMIFIASISTYVSSYCISTTGIHILIKEWVRLMTIQKGVQMPMACDNRGNISIPIFNVPQRIICYIPSYIKLQHGHIETCFMFIILKLLINMIFN